MNGTNTNENTVNAIFIVEDILFSCHWLVGSSVVVVFVVEYAWDK